MTEEINKYK